MAAQDDPRPPQYGTALVPGDTVLATPAGRYEAGPLHRWVLGRGWRELWATPVPAPVLDLATHGGGLTPLRLGGGQQTRSLRFTGADGLVYNFRSIDKDVSRGIDPILRRSLAQDVLQDQVGALFPLSAMVVAPLLDAVGILHPRPSLVVMPDDPRLGEYRADFAGLLGWIELRPDEGPDDTPGFAGSERVVGTDRLFERLEEEADNRIDAEAVLRARLMDMLVGDWDRHPDQWRWAGFERDGLLIFQPVPRDRDWALTRLDGLLPAFTQVPWPYYLGFDTDYASAFRQTWNGRGIDRRLLVSLDRAAVRRIAESVQSRLTDEVIETAVQALPEGYYDRVGPWLEAALKNRRDGLVALADEHYLLHAGWVDVETTDEDEVAFIERRAGGDLRVRVVLADSSEAPADPVIFDRVFVADETNEVRLYLRGGDDVAIVGGDEAGPIGVRVIGGGADDRFVDRTVGLGVAFYDDDDDDDVFEPGPTTRVDRREWEQPEDEEAEIQMTRPRDWGSRWIPTPLVSYDPDLGLFVGGRVVRTGWGFRHYPWASRLEASLGVGTHGGTVRARVAWEREVLEPGLRVRLAGAVSGAEYDRFYGFGNDTPERPDDTARARRSETRARGDLVYRAGRTLEIRGGAEVWAQRAADNEGQLISEIAPYGHGAFDQVAATLGVTIDHRDDAGHPRHGWRLDLDGRLVPDLLDADDSYGTLRGEARTYWSASDDTPLQPSLAVRVGGESVVWGRAPWFDAPTLGGPADLRGYLQSRFRGDAAAWGNAEVRLFLTEFLFLLPGELGVLGLADAGRVWVDGESPGAWHTAAGGGLWARFVDLYTVHLAAARSSETVSIYFGVGLPF